MAHVNIEIKARCKNQASIRKYLQHHGADFKGTDHQIDTYFVVPRGRLKLREGNIENALIYYERDDQAGPKQALVTKADVGPRSDLKEVLQKVLKVLVVVDKKREISFIGNVKFHLDDVKELGTFVEIEAIDNTGKISKEKLLKQCRKYLHDFGIKESDLVAKSYSDLIISQH